jgi:glycosyltransferase involved in cell wall biosynthesis
MGTFGRDEKIDRFLCHLVRQDLSTSIELIVVDQNDHDHVQKILRPYRDRFDINHLKATPGLSHARNVGLQHVSGSILAFPDDDCWYPEGLLENVERFFDENPEWHGLTGRSLDAEGVSSAGRWDRESGPIRKKNVWTRAISYTIFLRREVIGSVGEFDERLGVGAGTSWGSGEETDYLLRALQEGWQLWYDPETNVYHPSKTRSYGSESRKRAYEYGAGMGFVARKNNCSIPIKIKYVIRPILGIIISLLRVKPEEAKFYYLSLKGRIRGYYKIN